jgi:hypothetical protein
MIDLAPQQTRRYSATQWAGRRALGALLMLRNRTRPVWQRPRGASLLLRWDGELLPMPKLDCGPGGREILPADRRALIVGTALPAATEVLTFAGVGLAANTVAHFATVQVGGGGTPNVIDPRQVVTRVADSKGALVGLLPNPPAVLGGRMVGLKPVLRWTYSHVGQQADPASFAVYVATPAAEFNFAAAEHATVTYERGRRIYEWTGAALSAGDVRWYTVRAVTADDVQSLIPRLGKPPAPTYASLAKADAVKLIAPSATVAPPTIAALGVA